MANKKDLKAYVRYDGSGRLIPGALILNRFKPQVGKWEEIPADECCDSSNTSILLQENGDSLLQEDSSEILL